MRDRAKTRAREKIVEWLESLEEKKKKKNVIKIVNQEEISLSKNWREEKIYDPSLKKKTSDK